MVTVELDFGAKPPSIEEALAQIQRRSEPEDGIGRTFAILDAYGEPTRPESCTVDSQRRKTREGSPLFTRTGEVLWQSRIYKGTNAPAQNFATRGLIILMDNGAGHTVTVDGSKNPASILQANVNGGSGVNCRRGRNAKSVFLYSACGCPVKVLCLRTGEQPVE